MDIKLFKKNIKFFKKEKPEIYDFIKEKSKSFIDLKDTDEYTYLKSPTGEFLEDKKELIETILNNIELLIIPLGTEKQEELNRKWIHDKIIESLNELVKKSFSISKIREKVIKSKHIPLLFLNGIGLGNILNVLEKENIKVDNLLIYEPDFYKFIASLYLINWEDIYVKLKGDIFFIIGDNIEDIKRGLVIYFSQKSPVFSLFFVVINLNSENENLKNILIDAIRLSLKGWGYYDDEVEGLKHLYENLQKKYPYIERPLKTKKGSNLFIIGSGPSLDERIDFIKENKEKAVIFSCGTAIHKLYKEGIVPDFQIEIERPEFRVELFKDLPLDFRKKIDIIAADVVPYSLLELYKKPILFTRTYSVGQFLLNPILFVEGIAPTVVNTATALSVLLGFENIYFFGVDMGYKNINKKHATGTIYDSKVKEREEKIYIEIEGNEGDTIYTDEVLFWAKETLEQVINAAENQNFYNLSLGAKIKGSIFIKDTNKVNLSEFDKYSFIERNIYTNVSNNYKKLFIIDKRDHYKLAKEIIKTIKNLLEEIFETSDIEERFNKFYSVYDLLKSLYEENKVVYTLLSGTFKHILGRMLYLMYFDDIPKEKILERISYLELIEKNLDKIKEYFSIKL